MIGSPPPGVTVPPGDPAAFQDASRLLVAVAETLNRVGDGFQRTNQICDPGTWFGIAGFAFRHRVNQTKESVQIGAVSLRETAGALAQFAGRLDAAQRRARSALAVAESAGGTVAQANAALQSHLDEADPDHGAIARMRRDLEYAREDLAAARSAGTTAQQEVVEAARTAAAALNQATDSAKAPPPPPDPHMRPTELPGQFYRRQLGDVILGSVNPFASSHDDYEEGRVAIDWPVGLSIGGGEGIYKGYASNAKRLEGGYYSKLPTFVAAHTRRLPSGMRVPVRAHTRGKGVWVPPAWVDDLERQAIYRQRAEKVKLGGNVLGFALAAVDQVVEDAHRPDLDAGERARRLIIATAAVGISSAVGGVVGAFVGTLVPAPAVGTVAGGVVGGMIGAGMGEKLKGGVFEFFGVD
jgi:hypothetical protein